MITFHHTSIFKVARFSPSASAFFTTVFKYNQGRKWNNIRKELSDSCSSSLGYSELLRFHNNTRVFYRKCEASVYSIFKIPLNWILEALGVRGIIVPIELEYNLWFSVRNVSQLFAVWGMEFSSLSCASMYLVWARTWTAWAFLITPIYRPAFMIAWF